MTTRSDLRASYRKILDEAFAPKPKKKPRSLNLHAHKPASAPPAPKVADTTGERQ